MFRPAYLSLGSAELHRRAEGGGLTRAMWYRSFREAREILGDQ